ncbi:TM59L protein, partial [Pedionomus torquatus]|nr:TM59L protein [Pedionomus torquatus]
QSPELKVPSFSMFDLVSTFCNDIVSSAQSFISSTWTFYLQADDGKVVVFQSQPEMEYLVPEVQETQPERPMLCSPPLLVGPNSHPVPCHKLVLFPWRGAVGCYRRSGLPRWILAACLFLSIMVMLWLSCARLVTAPEQHPLSINGDKEYLEDLDGSGAFPLPPVIAVTLCPTHSGEDVGPLPLKVDLDKTVL